MTDHQNRPSASDPATVRAWLEVNDVFSVRVESISVDGWLFGKQVSVAKFLASIETGIPTADIAVAFDLGGTPQLGWWNDWRADIGDVVHRPDLDSLVLLPGFDRMAAVMADFCELSGTPIPIDPRATVRRLVDHLAQLGYEAKMALEIEAYVFEEDLATAAAGGFSGLTPLGGSRELGYAVTRSKALTTYLQTVAERAAAMGIDWEAWSDEIGPGQVEFNIAPADPLTAADSTIRVKTIMREVAHDLGHCVTFMSKPLELYGNGLHVNHSLTAAGEPVFYDPAASDGRSPVMRNWLGGLMASMAATQSFVSPWPTSYRRLQELDGPPTTVTWGENNKTTAIRAITRTPKATRFEHRVPSGDANPYLAIAAVLAGGIRGLVDQLDPPQEHQGMAWVLPADANVEQLPKSMMTAVAALRNDTRFTEFMGTELVDHWVASRRWEWLMFHTTGGNPDTAVSNWELRRYFEWV